MLTRQSLMKIKARALRQRVWFKALSRVERGIVDLTIRCVEKVKSAVLTSAIVGIVGKVLKILEDGFLEIVKRVGSAAAERVCRIAEGWGNKNASGWRHDLDLIRFLGVNAVNNQVASI